MPGVAQLVIESRKQTAESRGRKFRLRRPTRIREPKSAEREYRAELNAAMRKMEEAIAEILPEIPSLLDEAGTRGDVRDDGFSERLSALMSRLSSPVVELFDRIARPIATRISQRVSDFNRRQLQRASSRALGVDVFLTEPQLRDMQEAFVSENVALIKSLPDTTFREIETLVKRRVAAGDRAEGIQEEIRDRFGVSKSRAALIARDQVNKHNGALNRVRQKNLGVTHYIWRTSRDERVRAAHRDREGKRFAWDNPPEGGHPGQPIQCRCTAEPDFEGLL